MIGGRAASDRITPGRCIISVGNPASALPSGWAWTLLSDLADLGTGHTPSRKHPEYWDGDIPWVGIRDAGAHHGGMIYETMQHVTKLGLANSSARLLPKDTVCLSRTASVGYVVIMGKSMATSQDFVTWSCGHLLDPYFLARALVAEGDEIRRFGEGSTHTTIYFPEVKAFYIGLPPIREQHRIVAKVDRLSAKSHRVFEHLNHIPRLVEKYKQAILAAAYEGKLVGNIKAPTLPIREMIASLDQGWSPKCEGEPASDPEDWAVMKTTAIQPIHFNGAENKKLPARLTPRPLIAIEPEDVLITRAGPRSRVAIACVVKKTRQRLMLCDKAYRMRVKPAVTNATFLALMLNAPQSLETLEQMKTGISDSGLNLTQGKFLDLPIPNFSLVDQQEIVRRIGSAFTWIDRLASETTGARKLIDHLDQAILAKAFRGELVPQDPSDEPASVLLERIGAGRLATPILRSRSTKKNTSRAATKPESVRRRRRL
jgi:restriction endonuclease S subunit